MNNDRRDKQFLMQPTLFAEDAGFASAPSQPADPPKTTDWERDIQPSIDQVEENAAVDWKEVAADCLHTLAETRDEFTADDLVEMLETKEVHTHNLAALGPLFLRASKRGLIRNSGRMVQSRIPRRHRKITVWQSTQRG